ncbi:MAG: hypothetical protein ACREBV_03010, partial [Candidatus Zixiibacteriota bacterium]
MKLLKSLWVTVILLSFMVTAEGAVPHLMNFQGLLKTSGGSPVADSSYSVLFTIYDDSGGNDIIWSQTYSVTTSAGSFTVLLGGGLIPIPDSTFDDTTRYLGIKVGADPEMTPRQRLGSVGYSYRVGTVDGATGGVISGDVSIQSQLSVAGTIMADPPAPDMPGLVIQGSTGQTANLMEIKNSAGVPLISVGSDGDMDGLNSSWENGQFIDINCDGMLNVGVDVNVGSKVTTPEIELSGASTISNFPNPVPIELKTGKGSIFIGRDDGILQQVAADPGASLTKLQEWKNGAGEIVGSIDPSGALFSRYALFAHTTHCAESLKVDGDVTVAGNFQTSGISEVSGNDIVISLSTQHLAPVGIGTAPSADVALRVADGYAAGSLLHELGHNLRLRHDGGLTTLPPSDDFLQAVDESGTKVAHISAMGYVYCAGLQVNGSIATAVTVVNTPTSSITLNASHSVVLCNA